MNRRQFLLSNAAALASLQAAGRDEKGPNGEWRWYGGDAGASRYSPLKQINRSNVKDLKVAWIHKTGDARERPATVIECTPIVVDGIMYITTCQVKVQAVEAATGKLLWEFDPAGDAARSRAARGVNRGVCYWQDGGQKRIFSTFRDQLWSIDAATGKPDPKFGNQGVIDLKEHFDHNMAGLSFRHTSPVVVYKDLVITGGGGGEGPYPEAPGHIRGWDARTGERRWIFHTVPRPGEFGNDTWESDSWIYTGGTNCWAGMSVDEGRGLLFAGIGSPAFDFYGGNRKGMNLSGNCVLCLNAGTGERVWHYQTVHHDVWDYDLPAQPALIQMRRGGQVIDAVVQVTKQGFLFFLDRQTGEPIFPVEERPIPKSDIEGERLWPTQPHPLKPPPVSRQGFRDEWITDISPEAHAFVKAQLKDVAYGPLFTPPKKTGGIIHPGFRGGPLWGGCSYDPEQNLVIVSSDETTNRIVYRDGKPGEPFRYGLTTREQLLDHEGYPGIKAPWGYITAIDLDSGDFKWRIVNGEFDELKKRGIPKTGCNSHGGTITTGGGLVFMAGTFDRRMRAYDSSNGKVLWEFELPAGGFATPSTYEANGKQYVVIAAGGGKNGSKATDEFYSFALS